MKALTYPDLIRPESQPNRAALHTLLATRVTDDVSAANMTMALLDAVAALAVAYSGNPAGMGESLSLILELNISELLLAKGRTAQ